MKPIFYPSLNEEQLHDLDLLYSHVTHRPEHHDHRHLGVNKHRNLSDYLVSKSFEWKQAQRECWDGILPHNQTDASLISWFLTFEPDKGLLDRMEYWVNKPQAGTIIAYALSNDSVIALDGVRYLLHRGEGIGFSLRLPHEVPRSDNGSRWACMLVLGDPDRHTPHDMTLF